MKYYITKHCVERYVERINNGLNNQHNIFDTIFKILNKGKDITNIVYDKCPRYILYLYEKYQTAGQVIIESDNIIFICRKRKGTDSLYDVLTCYHKNDYLKQYINTVLTRQEIFIKINAIKKTLK